MIKHYDFNPNYIWDHNYVLMMKMWEKIFINIHVFFIKLF